MGSKQLFAAIAAADLASAAQLVREGADVSALDEQGHSALTRLLGSASCWARATSTRALVDVSLVAAPAASDRIRVIAALKRHCELSLSQAKAAADTPGEAVAAGLPLHEATRLVEELTAAGCAVRLRDGGQALVDQLLDAGAAVDLRSPEGMPLHLACWIPDPVVIARLLAQGADVAALCAKGMLPLHLALRRWGHAETEAEGQRAFAVARLLVAAGADVDALSAPPASSTEATRPVHEAPHEAALSWLLQQGADIDGRSGRGRTVLHRACTDPLHSAELVPWCLEHGADPNAVDDRGAAPLPALDDVSLVDAMLAAGAEVDQRDRAGRTALYHAVEHPDLARVQLLLAAGADADASATDGSTPRSVAYDPAVVALLAGS
jgi:ankyrin repeat protein